MSHALPTIYATTVLGVRRDGKVAIGGDGQVSVGETVMKSNAQKVRALARRQGARGLRRRGGRRVHALREVRGEARALSRESSTRGGGAGQGLAQRPRAAASRGAARGGGQDARPRDLRHRRHHRARRWDSRHRFRRLVRALGGARAARAHEPVAARDRAARRSRSPATSASTRTRTSPSWSYSGRIRCHPNRTQQAVARLADLTPRQIVAELDRYIVGQGNAKKAVAIALRNRWRRQQAPDAIRDEIAPNNIILIGPTGVGKTEIARRLAQLAGAPFIKVEASKFTEVGYVGATWSRWCATSWRAPSTWCARSARTMWRTSPTSAWTSGCSTSCSPSRRRTPRHSTRRAHRPHADRTRAVRREPERRGVARAGGRGGRRAVQAHAREAQQLLLDGKLEDREVEVEVTNHRAPIFDMMEPQGAPEGMDELHRDALRR